MNATFVWVGLCLLCFSSVTFGQIACPSSGALVTLDVLSGALEDAQLAVDETKSYCFQSALVGLGVGGIEVTLGADATLTLSEGGTLPFSGTLTNNNTGATQSFSSTNLSLDLIANAEYTLTLTGVEAGTRDLTISTDIVTVPIVGTTISLNETSTVTVTAALPVTWTAPLTYEAIGKRIRLEWAVADQVDVAGYELEIDRGTGFQTAQTLAVIEKGNGEVVYTAFEATPSQTVYYRVRQLDYDGKFSFSNILRVDGRDEQRLTVYPNPSSGEVYVSGLADIETIDLCDMTGRVVKRYRSQQIAEPLDVSTLTPGVYLLRVATTAEGNVVNRKLVVR